MAPSALCPGTKILKYSIQAPSEWFAARKTHQAAVAATPTAAHRRDLRSAGQILLPGVRCVRSAATTASSFTSYVELLTCLEMARDAATTENSPENPSASSVRPMQAGQPGLTIGERH